MLKYEIVRPLEGIKKPFTIIIEYMIGVEAFNKTGFKPMMGESQVRPDWIFPTLMCNLSP